MYMTTERTGSSTIGQSSVSDLWELHIVRYSPFNSETIPDYHTKKPRLSSDANRTWNIQLSVNGFRIRKPRCPCMLSENSLLHHSVMRTVIFDGVSNTTTIWTHQRHRWVVTYRNIIGKNRKREPRSPARKMHLELK